jgi:signal transduction histidine kinase/CheY-like chemotaxis protein/HPt (histidine-containing phosphotransfer) domain-containing protein
MPFTFPPEAAMRIRRWGEGRSPDPRRAKRIGLANGIALIAIPTTVIYAAIYPLMGVPLLSAFSLLTGLGFAIVLLLNRWGFTWTSRFLVPLVANAGILIAVLSLGTNAGFQLFLLPFAWLVLIVFDWEERKSMVFGVGLTMALMLALEAFGPSNGLIYRLSESQDRFFHFFVVSTAQVVQILVVLYFFLANRRTETALAEAGEAAKSADKAKSQFLANMSHEIRTPLNGILGMSSLLLKSDMRGDQKDLVQAVQSSGLDLMSIISEILDLSKIEAGRMRMEAAPFSVTAVLEGVLRPFEHEARRKRLDLYLDIAPGLPGRVVGDSARLKQVLNNLIGNALKFTAKGGVTIRLREDVPDAGAAGRDPAGATPARNLVFQIEDTGVGIPEEAQGRIFQSFSQADKSIARQYGGTGLGLFLCKQIVEMMGGKIGFRTRPGEGSTFHFTLPFPIASGSEDADLPRQERRSESRVSGPAAAARLLIVEDHPLNQKVLCGFLAQFGLSADAASGGQEALRMFSAEPYDMVFMDCHMPGMDGFECTRALRSMRAGAKPPVIVGVTADAMHGTREKCLGAGMNEVITKPIMTEELHRVLSGWLGVARPAPLSAAPAPPSSWVDVRHLREMDEWIRTFDPGFWERALEQFRGSAKRLLHSIRTAHEEGKSKDAGEAAHALKGLCLMMGLSRMGEACRKLETLENRGEGTEWCDRVQELESFMEPSLQEMRKQVGQT